MPLSVLTLSHVELHQFVYTETWILFSHSGNTCLDGLEMHMKAPGSYLFQPI